MSDTAGTGPSPNPAQLPDPATSDVVDLFRAICDLPSVSGDEAALADEIERALTVCAHLRVDRLGNSVVARTSLGRDTRVVVAGHLDTVPIADNLPTELRVEGGEQVLWGRGTVDMKGGVAVALSLAARLTDPVHDVTWVFYDNEEVDSDLNGLGQIVRTHPDWVTGDVAVLGEPTAGGIEGGCNGTIRVVATTRGTTAHSARAWRGHNAVHDAAPILARLAAYEPGEVEVDGLVYRESLNAVGIAGGIATNMIPDACSVTINYRFAPSTSPDEAVEHVRELLAGIDCDLTVTDAVGGARPGLDSPALRAAADTLTAATGGKVGPKYGWTDVARFAELGIPALNFGPGDPMLAHADDERCPTAQVRDCARALTAWLAPA
ncbi:N-succinyl-L,L-diaminopimelate desuccinylase [Actinomycetales bacterium JB111]|nr:N-succinyl-L,L-diaminopimelate desuccinylase [Actinomycetales bacterium JB111]